MIRCGWALAALLLSGCASPIPEPIRLAPPDNPTVAEVRADPARFAGRQVLWGGTVAAVDNRRDHTEIELVARALDDDGRPHADDTSQGRFIAEMKGFVDPAIYAKGRAVTVRGAVTGDRVRPIGDYSYRFPLVAADHTYLWPEELEPRYAYPPPWYYDPFWPPFRRPYWGPWYPYGW